LPKAPAAIRIGTAGWSIPKEHAAPFPTLGSHLERYAAVFNAVEINSSFYRPHRPATYERWAASVPQSFRFSVKIPKTVTHERRLKGASDLLERFLSEVNNLGPKLGPLLVQLPPSLAFETGTSDAFLRGLRSRAAGSIVCEPRHRSWFTPEVDGLPAWPLIQHPYRELASPAAGAACHTIACTGHRGSTTRRTARKLLRAQPRGLRGIRQQAQRLIASSTTLPPSRQLAMHSVQASWFRLSRKGSRHQRLQALLTIQSEFALSHRQAIVQSTLGPERILAARDLQARALAEITLEHLTIVANVPPRGSPVPLTPSWC
jgi:hypothetical protein